MEENESFEREVAREKVHIKAMPFIWLFSIIGAIVFFILDKNWGLNYILGVATSLFGLTMMLYTVNTTKIEHLKSKMIINYFIRYIMYAIVLIVVWQYDGIKEIWTTVVGIMVVKVVLIAYALINKGKKV